MPYDFANTILKSIDLQDQLNVKKQEMKTEEMHYNTQLAVQNRQFAFNVQKDAETRQHQQQQEQYKMYHDNQIATAKYFAGNSPYANLPKEEQALLKPDANGYVSNEQLSNARGILQLKQGQQRIGLEAQRLQLEKERMVKDKPFLTSATDYSNAHSKVEEDLKAWKDTDGKPIGESHMVKGKDGMEMQDFVDYGKWQKTATKNLDELMTAVKIPMSHPIAKNIIAEMNKYPDLNTKREAGKKMIDKIVNGYFPFFC